MATPLYDALLVKIRDWSNKPEVATIPASVLGDCLTYGADDCYRYLRIPPLEQTLTYTVTSADNPENSDYTKIPIPADLTEFIYLRNLREPNLTYGPLS